MWKDCREWKNGGGSWQEAIGWILSKEGDGKKRVREIKEVRKKEEEERI